MPSKKIYFITGNTGKFNDALDLFKSSDIKLIQKNIETPEIQSTSSTQISEFSASFISKFFNKPFFVMDRSFHIKSLNGFPGPFVKFINKWLTASQISSLVSSKNTFAHWNTSICVYLPNNRFKTFSSSLYGNICLNPEGIKGYTVDRIFIPSGHSHALSEFSNIENKRFWNSDACWNELLKYLRYEKF